MADRTYLAQEVDSVKVKSVKWLNKLMTIKFSINGDDEEKKSRKLPHPDLLEALKVLGPFVNVLAELQPDKDRPIEVTGVSWSYDGTNARISISFKRGLKNHPSPMGIATPAKWLEAQDALAQMPEEYIAPLNRVHDEAIRYLFGKFGQSELFEEMSEKPNGSPAGPQDNTGDLFEDDGPMNNGGITGGTGEDDGAGSGPGEDVSDAVFSEMPGPDFEAGLLPYMPDPVTFDEKGDVEEMAGAFYAWFDKLSTLLSSKKKGEIGTLNNHFIHYKNWYHIHKDEFDRFSHWLTRTKAGRSSSDGAKQLRRETANLAKKVRAKLQRISDKADSGGLE